MRRGSGLQRPGRPVGQQLLAPRRQRGMGGSFKRGDFSRKGTLNMHAWTCIRYVGTTGNGDSSALATLHFIVRVLPAPRLSKRSSRPCGRGNVSNTNTYTCTRYSRARSSFDICSFNELKTNTPHAEPRGAPRRRRLPHRLNRLKKAATQILRGFKHTDKTQK